MEYVKKLLKTNFACRAIPLSCLEERPPPIKTGLGFPSSPAMCATLGAAYISTIFFIFKDGEIWKGGATYTLANTVYIFIVFHP